MDCSVLAVREVIGRFRRQRVAERVDRVSEREELLFEQRIRRSGERLQMRFRGRPFLLQRESIDDVVRCHVLERLAGRAQAIANERSDVAEVVDEAIER